MLEKRMEDLVNAARAAEKAVYDLRFDDVTIAPSVRNALLDLIDEVYRVAEAVRRRSE